MRARRLRLAGFVAFVSLLILALLFSRERLLRDRGDFEADKAMEGEHRPKLRLLVYASFMGTAGPGGEIVRQFERAHGCQIEVVTSADAGLLLERLRIGQSSSPFDVVIGLDQFLLEEARKSFTWSSHEIAYLDHLQPEVKDLIQQIGAAEVFVPLDWSPLSFVYRVNDDGLGGDESQVASGNSVPRRFDDLAGPEFGKQFALEDPRLSSPGLQFVQWVKAIKGERTAAWLRKFSANVNSVSPSWAMAYGIFTRGQSRFVFSYLTSLAYHWGDEKDRRYRVLSFPEGHPVQVEFAGVPASCRQCALAKVFLAGLLTAPSQDLIMRKNYMFPVLEGVKEGSVFAELPRLTLRRTENGHGLKEWDEVFPR